MKIFFLLIPMVLFAFIFISCRTTTLSPDVKALLVDNSGNRLKVVFFLLFPTDYLIIELDEKNYQWAAVTGPSLDTLWVLSREPSLPGELYESIIDFLVEKGFSRDKIIKTSRQE